MSVGKYSPTVSSSYAADQNWWEKNGGGYDNGIDPNSDNDDDGYDRYGYDANDTDRAGHQENDYLLNYSEYDGQYTYHLYEDVSSEWAGVRIYERKEKAKSLENDEYFVKNVQMRNELQDIIKNAKQLLLATEQRIENKLQGK